MFRTTDIVLICVMIAAAAFTYKTKHDAEGLLSEVRRIERQIQFEKDTMIVLRADWSVLTQPARLQKLAEIYKEQLGLELLEPTQIGSIAELPPRPLTIEQVLTEQAAAPRDPITTGGVRP